MLSAYDEKGQLICLADGQKVEGTTFSCPACQAEVILKKGSCYRPHFAHKRLKDCLFHQENESEEHLSLKAMLYQSLSQSEDVKIEFPFYELKQIADLVVNHQLILEVQCSPISRERLKERTLSYRQSGYQVLWLLGQKLWLRQRLTRLQKDFLYFSENMGFHLWELEAEQKLLRLKYLIHEDLEGRVHYLTKVFDLDSLTLTDFRAPFVKQGLSFMRVKQNEHLLNVIQKHLFYRSPLWMKRQAKAYERGENLLTKSLEEFYPQVRLPQTDQNFLQIIKDLSDYYANFLAFYGRQKDKTVQLLYPPAYLTRYKTLLEPSSFLKI